MALKLTTKKIEISKAIGVTNEDYYKAVQLLIKNGIKVDIDDI